MDFNKKLEEAERKSTLQNLMLEALGTGLKDSRFNCIAKLSRMERGLMAIVMADTDNKEQIMGEEIEKLVNETYQRFNAILRNYNKEEV